MSHYISRYLSQTSLSQNIPRGTSRCSAGNVLLTFGLQKTGRCPDGQKVARDIVGVPRGCSAKATFGLTLSIWTVNGHPLAHAMARAFQNPESRVACLMPHAETALLLNRHPLRDDADSGGPHGNSTVQTRREGGGACRQAPRAAAPHSPTSRSDAHAVWITLSTSP